MTTNQSLIPPGPWGVKGNTVVDGYGQTIAVVFYKHHPGEIARFIAEMMEQPDLRAAEARIEEMEEEIKKLEDENDRLEDRITDLESELDDAHDKLNGETKE